MHCPICNALNRDVRKFCRECGAGLDSKPCPSCDFVNLQGENFCGQCGLGLNAPAAAPVLPALPRKSAERRRMTVMFCDMVGSTALSSQLDAEDLRDLLTSFQDVCRGAIRRREGFIARYMGDGLLVYFGYPRVHEDDAERAVRAGLDIVHGVAALPSTVAVRIGIATGDVVVGDLIGEGASEEAAVIGETPNLAARLQGVCPPGQVVVDGCTQELVDKQMVFADLGRHALKGFREPVSVWRAMAERIAQKARLGDEGRIVGRDAELGVIRQRWAAAVQGQGGCVLVEGPAGTGKSRLVGTLAGLASRQGTLILQSKRTTRNTPLAPFIGLIAQRAQLAIEDTAAEREEKVAAWVRTWAVEQQDRLAICTVMSAEAKGLGGSPEEQRAAILEALERYFEHQAAHMPVCVMLEDAHWADPSTLGLIGSWMGKVASRQVLVVVTYRPQLEVPWPLEGEHVVHLGLGGLAPQDARDLVSAVAGQVALADDVVETIVERADGVPFYLEELTLSVLSADRSQAIRVPDTLQASLLAKLDRVGAGRRVALAASVLGRTFDPILLAGVMGQADDRLRATLDLLVDHDLMRVEQDGSYLFKHALVRDAAYGALLRSTRKSLHERVAKLLTTDFLDSANTDPALAAYHLGRAGRAAEAAHWWGLAAAHATKQAATDEAIRALEQALELTNSVAVGDPTQLVEERVALRAELAQQLRLVARFDRAFELLDQAIALAGEYGLCAARSSAYFALGNLHYNLGANEECVAAQKAALADAERVQRADLEVQALGGLGDAYTSAGDFSTALTLIQRCVARADELGLSDIAAAYAPLVALLEMYGLRVEAATEAVQAAIPRAQKTERRRSLAVSQHLACLLAVLRQDVQALTHHHREFREVCRAMGVLGAVLRGVYLHELHRMRGESDAATTVALANLERAPSAGPGRRFWASLALAVPEADLFEQALEETQQTMKSGPQWTLVTLPFTMANLIRGRQSLALRETLDALEQSPAITSAMGRFWRDVAQGALLLIEEPESPEAGRRGAELIAVADRAGVSLASTLVRELLRPQ